MAEQASAVPAALQALNQSLRPSRPCAAQNNRGISILEKGLGECRHLAVPATGAHPRRAARALVWCASNWDRSSKARSCCL